MPKLIDDKRAEAKARQEAYDKLSPQQKLQRLEQKGVKSGKEYKKLLKQIEK
jgi:hypothetical protein